MSFRASFVMDGAGSRERFKQEDALKESPDPSRIILALIEDVVALEDREGLLVFLSPSVQRLTGLTPEQLLGTPGLDLVHTEDRSRAEQATADSLRDGRVREIEFRCRTRDGPYRWVSARTQVLPDEEGQPFRVLRCLRDISERKEREEALRQAQQLEAVGRLAAGLAHDFNNLLTIITGYACVLLEGHGPGDPDHDMLCHIQRAADRSAALVRQLLAFAGRQLLNLTLVDLNTFILHRTEIFKRLLGPHTRLHLHLDPALQRVHVDPAGIEQVLLDLAANARDAMPSGGQFSLTTANVCAEPSRAVVRLTVADTGRGMDEHVLAHLFEPFFTTKDVGQGTGLGLAAVYGTVKQCGGRITASSRPGEGTIFTIDFPAAAAREEGQI